MELVRPAKTGVAFESWSALPRRLSQALVSTPFLGVALAALTWPIRSIVPRIGPDPSWLAGLYMAHHEGLQFGTQFVFSYGPLGFLEQPVLYDASLWTLSFLYQGFVHVALAISLLWVARRGLPLLVALAACYLLLVIGPLEGAVVLLAFVWCTVALAESPPAFAAPVVVFGGGIIGAVELLGKANLGIAVVGLCAVTLLGIPSRRRNLARFAAVLAIALGALWVLSGQSLSNVPDFVANTAQVVSGYSSAMATNISDVRWERPFAVAAVGLLFAGAAAATWRSRPPRRLAMLALVGLFGFLAFKQGFVRQGLGNSPGFFALMLGASLAVGANMPSRLPRLLRLSAAVVLIAPLLALTVATLPTPSFWSSLGAGDHITFLRQEVRAFLSPAERDRLREEGRSSMRSVYRLDRRTLDLIAHRAVAVDPWEIGVAWAYGLDWHPLPVIQSYSAYTKALDRLDAESLRAPAGPELILRQNPKAFLASEDESIDDRYRGWDSPAASRAMLCNYLAVRTTARWQLLERSGNRCAAPRLIESVRSQTGARIRVPAPPARRDVVFARIEGLGVEGWEGLRTLLYRARQRTATINGRESWRVVPETAPDGLLMWASEAVDYPGPFRLAPEARTFSVRVQGTAPRQIEARFFAQRVSAAQVGSEWGGSSAAKPNWGSGR